MKVYYVLAIFLGFAALTACSSITAPSGDKRAIVFERANALLSEGQYESAYNETQRILKEESDARDLALFNLGMISAHSANPKKNYPRALSYFRTLVKEYPQSPVAEPAKTWIQVLEEYQRMSEEKRLLVREREVLMQEKEKLKYANEKSRQVDVEIEKRRREMLRK